MSLQFVFGNSGSGKSEYLYRWVLEQAAEHTDRNYIMLVPEQFTMQIQRELVERHKNHAIMNVDVLSFARLAYRVFDELGKQDLVILEETGKNLVLRKVAEQKRAELSVLGGRLNKMGYISEIKSLLSELTQYNITPGELSDFLERSDVGEALSLKMRDILAIYQGFRDYLEGRYITAEEVLSLLCRVAGESSLLRGSVIVCDEFTGFTPIQNQLLRELLLIADKIMVSAVVDVREDIYESGGIHELFAMSKKTVQVLLKIAADSSVQVEEPIILPASAKKRYRGAPELFFMEQNLFRAHRMTWEEAPAHVRIAAAKNPRAEITFAAKEITRLVRAGGCRYREIALVTGDVPQYANYVPEIFEQFEIPFFIDQTRMILFHPFIELIRAALEVVESDFSYVSVFRFFRSGLVQTLFVANHEARILTEEEIDLLENYVLAHGVFGRRRWSRVFTLAKKTEREPDEQERETIRLLNEIRRAFMDLFAPLVTVFSVDGEGGRQDVSAQTYALYQFIYALRIEEQLKAKQQELEASGNMALAKEYAQIYKIVMDLLDKVTSLLGGEVMTVREYGDILDAGFEAARVGIIPPGNDRVIVGDIERSRLSHIKILFFLGVNDGIVPKNSGSGGIISQYERDKMKEQKLELAPGAREKVFIQKFYLYLNLTKPSQELYLTYAKTASDGKALRCSYLIGVLQKLFPALLTEQLEERETILDVLTPQNALRFYIEGLQSREYTEAWAALGRWYLSRETYAKEAKRLLAAAYDVYTGEPISRAVARALYGRVLENSVTRLERFAACAFAHYLDYGLRLKDREIFGFASVDMGNIYHEVLERFANRLGQSKYTWFSIPEEIQRQWVEECMEETILGAERAQTFEEARNRFLLFRMKGTLQQAVWALITQIRKGKFVPRDFEVSFSRVSELSALQFRLSEDEKMQLQGRIDRIDTCEDEERVYVKVIDYKSGNTSFSLLNLYHGLQLQLVVYLNAAMELEAKKYPGKQIEPAGIFYYHVTNPIVEGNGAESEEQIRQAILEKLKLNGVVNEEEQIYRAMDEEFSGNSAVIPLGVKADGSLKAASKTLSTGEFQMISDYVNGVLVESGRKILAGDVSVQPFLLADKTGCDYCPYHMVCGFDRRGAGYDFKKLESFTGEEEILEAMRRKKTDGSEMDRGAAAGH